MSKPAFETYSLKELHDALAKVNKEKYEENYNALLAELSYRDNPKLRPKSLASQEQSYDSPSGEIQQASTGVHEIPFRFTGRPSEYFRIWIVNVILTILTLGIYSAWAKVRTKRYFFANTLLDGHRFEYLAKPLSILKGRFLVLSSFALVSWGSYAYLQDSTGLSQIVVIYLALPWLMVKTYIFNARNSAYRNIRFGFKGSLKQSAKIYWLGYLLTVVTCGLAYMWFAKKRHQFRVDNTRFGTTPFAFYVENNREYWETYLGGFAVVMLITLVFFRPMVSIVSNLGFSTDYETIATVIILIIMLFYYTYLKVGLTNTLFGHTKIEDSRFVSTLSVAPLFLVYFTNTIAIIVSLGLLTPWAMIRAARFRAKNLTLVTFAGLADFVPDERQFSSAVGEEVGEFVGLDLGF